MFLHTRPLLISETFTFDSYQKNVPLWLQKSMKNCPQSYQNWYYFLETIFPLFWFHFGRLLGGLGTSGAPKSRKIGKATRGKRGPFQKLLPIAQPGRVTRPGYLILSSKTFILDLENRPGPAECAQRLNNLCSWESIHPFVAANKEDMKA